MNRLVTAARGMVVLLLGACSKESAAEVRRDPATATASVVSSVTATPVDATCARWRSGAGDAGDIEWPKLRVDVDAGVPAFVWVRSVSASDAGVPKGMIAKVMTGDDTDIGLFRRAGSFEVVHRIGAGCAVPPGWMALHASEISDVMEGGVLATAGAAGLQDAHPPAAFQTP